MSRNDIVYCRVPRGANACSRRMRFVAYSLSNALVVVSRSDEINILYAYNGPGGKGGGTVVFHSEDKGETWSRLYFPVNTGIFESGPAFATLTRDGSVLFYTTFFATLGGGLQKFFTLNLDKGDATTDETIGRASNSVYLLTGLATLTDGSVVVAGNRAKPDATELKPAGLRRITSGDDLSVAPWTPIRQGYVHGFAGSARGAAILTSPGHCALEVTSLRGLRLGNARPVSAETRGGACPADDGAGEAGSLAVDSSGGRHAVWVSSKDGCATTWDRDGFDQDNTCIVYRSASPGGDFGLKSMVLAKAGIISGRPLVGAGSDGKGWVAWDEGIKQNDKFGTIAYHVRLAPTLTTSRADVGAHAIALDQRPNGECQKKGTTTLRASVSGPRQGKPVITRVKWAIDKPLVPRRVTDSAAPFEVRLSPDQRIIKNYSKPTPILSSNVVATVSYRAGTKRKTAKLSQVVSYFCRA